MGLFSFAQNIQQKKAAYEWFISSSSSFDQSYVAIINYADSQGYQLPSAEQQIKQNQLVVDLKAAGIWDLLDVFYVFATNGDSDFATLNWKNPALFQCTKVNSPTFTVNQGFTGNGTSSFLNTPYNFSTGINFTQNSASFGFHQNNVVETLNNLSGSGTAATSIIGGTSGGKAYYRINSSGPSNTGVAITSNGFSHINRSGIGTNLFFNGSAIYQFDILSGPTSNDNLSLLRRGGSFSTAQLSCAFVGGNMFDNATDFYNAWNTYLTSL